MSLADPRGLILVALVAIGNLLLPLVEGPRALGAARWPTEERFYALDGWQSAPTVIETAHGNTYLSRQLTRPDGRVALFSIVTSPQAKTIYRAGPDVPLLGSGYAAEADPSIAPRNLPNAGALRYWRGSERGVMLYIYGERRGAFGNGPLAWGLVTFDGLLQRPNDYYLARVMASTSESDPALVGELSDLAETLFKRLAVWYES